MDTKIFTFGTNHTARRHAWDFMRAMHAHDRRAGFPSLSKPYAVQCDDCPEARELADVYGATTSDPPAEQRQSDRTERVREQRARAQAGHNVTGSRMGYVVKRASGKRITVSGTDLSSLDSMRKAIDEQVADIEQRQARLSDMRAVLAYAEDMKRANETP